MRKVAADRAPPRDDPAAVDDAHGHRISVNAVLFVHGSALPQSAGFLFPGTRAQNVYMQGCALPSVFLGAFPHISIQAHAHAELLTRSGAVVWQPCNM